MQKGRRHSAHTPTPPGAPSPPVPGPPSNRSPGPAAEDRRRGPPVSNRYTFGPRASLEERTIAGAAHPVTHPESIGILREAILNRLPSLPLPVTMASPFRRPAEGLPHDNPRGYGLPDQDPYDQEMAPVHQISIEGFKSIRRIDRLVLRPVSILFYACPTGTVILDDLYALRMQRTTHLR